MSATSALLVRTWRVGRRTVTMTVPRPQAGGVMHLAAEWDPSKPSRLSADEWRQYRDGRNQAIAEIAAELGIRIGMLDV